MATCCWNRTHLQCDQQANVTRSTFFADYEYRRRFTRFDTIVTFPPSGTVQRTVRDGSSCISTWTWWGTARLQIQTVSPDGGKVACDSPDSDRIHLIGKMIYKFNCCLGSQHANCEESDQYNSAADFTRFLVSLMYYYSISSYFALKFYFYIFRFHFNLITLCVLISTFK